MCHQLYSHIVLGTTLKKRKHSAVLHKKTLFITIFLLKTYGLTHSHSSAHTLPTLASQKDSWSYSLLQININEYNLFVQRAVTYAKEHTRVYGIGQHWQMTTKVRLLGEASGPKLQSAGTVISAETSSGLHETLVFAMDPMKTSSSNCPAISHSSSPNNPTPC